MKRTPLVLLAFLAICLTLLLQATTQTVPAQETVILNEDTYVIRIHYTSGTNLDQLWSQYAFWEVNREEQYVVVDVTLDQIDDIEALGFNVTIDEALTESVRRVELSPDQRGGIPGYACYRTVEETFDTAVNLANDYPTLAKWHDVGDSWAKTENQNAGYDMQVLQITNFNIDPTDKPKLFITSAIHAREYTTAELNTRFAEHLIANYGVDPDITWILDYHDIHLMLQANPDGRKIAERGFLWRKNANTDICTIDEQNSGVDLNRNFEFDWGCCNGSSGDQCSALYRGPSPASEPETQSVQQYMRDIFPDWRGPNLDDAAPDDAWGVYLDIHSFSQLILWPWGATNDIAPNGEAMQTFGRKLAWFNGYRPQQSVDLYPTDGTTGSHGYGELGIASFTYELGTEFFQACSVFEETVYPDNLPSLVYAAKVVRTPYLTPAGPDVIDLNPVHRGVEGSQAIIRATADDGRFNNRNGTEPVQPVAAAEFYVGTPPWVDGAVATRMTAVDGQFNNSAESIQATVDLSELSEGRHQIFIRSMDSDGNWGAVSSTFLDVVDQSQAAILSGNVSGLDRSIPLNADLIVGGEFYAVTNASGDYNVQVIQGAYDVTVVPEDTGYPSLTTAVNVNADTVQDFGLYPYCNILTEDYESGQNGWVASDERWGLIDTIYHSPTHAWTDSEGGLSGNGRDTTLTSPVYDLSEFVAVELNYWQICDMEPNDLCRVEVSADGATWHEVGQSSGGTTWENIAFEARQLDSSDTAQVRFRLTTSGAFPSEGWIIDDLTLRGSGASCTYSEQPSYDIFLPILEN